MCRVGSSPTEIPDSRVVQPSVNDLIVGCLVKALQVRNLQRAHGLDHLTEHFVSATVLSEALPRGPQDSEDLRPIKPLPFTMLAETHGVLCLVSIPATRSALDGTSAGGLGGGIVKHERGPTTT